VHCSATATGPANCSATATGLSNKLQFTAVHCSASLKSRSLPTIVVAVLLSWRLKDVHHDYYYTKLREY